MRLASFWYLGKRSAGSRSIAGGADGAEFLWQNPRDGTPRLTRRPFDTPQTEDAPMTDEGTGCLVILSGPSCVGESPLAKALAKLDSEREEQRIETNLYLPYTKATNVTARQTKIPPVEVHQSTSFSIWSLFFTCSKVSSACPQRAIDK